MDRLAKARGTTRSELLRALANEEEARTQGLGVVTREELLELLSREARAGGVRAMALLADELRHDQEPAKPDEDPFAALDELSPRRRPRIA